MFAFRITTNQRGEEGKLNVSLTNLKNTFFISTLNPSIGYEKIMISESLHPFSMDFGTCNDFSEQKYGLFFLDCDMLICNVFPVIMGKTPIYDVIIA